MARAMWKGRVVLGEVEVPVKLYSAVERQRTGFHLLHADDLVPVKQRWVRKSDGKEVESDDLSKAHPVDRETAVVVTDEELAELEPDESREIEVCRFVPTELVDDRWYDRPYYLGPDEDEAAWQALAAALEKKDVEGIARWVMRKKRYVGSLRVVGGYPMLITLRRAAEVVSVEGVRAPKRAKPDPAEMKLAKQLVSALEADFDPTEWHHEYRERVQELLAAKARGETIEIEAPKKKRAAGSLSDSLKQSLRAAKGRKVA